MIAKIINFLKGRSLKEKDVAWVVNDLGELGVRIEGENFYLYKGRSLSYGNGGRMWRPVGKREFGECCHPLAANGIDLHNYVGCLGEDLYLWTAE